MLQEDAAAGAPVVFEPVHVMNRIDAKDLRYVRQSNLLAIEPKPFDRDTFETEEEKVVDEQGITRIKLSGNTIRWRNVTDPDSGETYRQSNARFVRWSDGSLQLLLGSEVLDVASQDISADRTFMFSRQAQYIQVQAQQILTDFLKPASF